jgi:hypothetical protein
MYFDVAMSRSFRELNAETAFVIVIVNLYIVNSSARASYVFLCELPIYGISL